MGLDGTIEVLLIKMKKIMLWKQTQPPNLWFNTAELISIHLHVQSTSAEELCSLGHSGPQADRGLTATLLP